MNVLFWNGEIHLTVQRMVNLVVKGLVASEHQAWCVCEINSYLMVNRNIWSREDWLVGWLLNVPATDECISGTDLLRQFYVLPH